MVLEFDGFRIDFERRQLFRGESEVHLSPKALQLLRILIEARPRALSREEIHDALWPATFVSESNLASIVNELRRALEDEARAPRFIRTVHAYGYAFCAEPRESSTQRPGLPVAKLVMERREEFLYAGRTVIGRDPGSAICVDDPAISRHHAAVTVGAATAVLEDLRSKNGTYLDGVLMRSAVPLRDGSVVELGSVRMVYREISTASTNTLYR